MRKNAFVLFFLLLMYGINGQICCAAGNHKSAVSDSFEKTQLVFHADTTLPADVMDVIRSAVYSLNNFDIEKVANLYTPNAVVADDEPPYSWNGPTAGVQWVNAVEQVCKDNKLTKLKGSIEAINVYQQNTDNVYVVVPVSYNGLLPGNQRFNSKGAFTFVLRLINGKWLIKSQVWMPKRGL
jgi:ketosteroid isomerase-like protein